MTSVSVIIPCLNESKTISTVLQAIHDQDYPIETLEVIIADGGSEDGTLEKINEFQMNHPNLTIKTIHNPMRQIPTGLNLAIEASTGEIIVRMDGHSLPASDYINRCVHNLNKGLGENVGGRWEIIPGADTFVARGIAAAASHPLGVGNVKYRISGQAGSVDTVPFGSYYRTLFDRIGLFDESLLTNEDYELNTRIRQNGGIIWFDPEIRCQYYSRPSLLELSKQYWRYGFWKAKMVKRYPLSIKPRQFLPPAFVSGLLLLLIGGLFSPLLLYGLLFVFLGYLGIIMLASIPGARDNNDPSLLVSMPLAIMTMHLTWGTGFIAGLITK